ncbi:MAG: hypothetical protein M1135_02145 [Candidatus Omnitrophica bacterium]|nr:hypothetical protein [Candidatus Omnitrophota bacterium]
MIYVECKSDVALVESLGISRKEIEHKSGKSGVCKILQKQSNSIGLVDEDPGAGNPSYIKTLKSLNEKNDIKIFIDNINKNKLIMLCPQLEGWILKVSKKSGIKFEKYGLSNGERLHSKINLKIPDFKKFLKELSKTDEIIFLKEQFDKL